MKLRSLKAISAIAAAAVIISSAQITAYAAPPEPPSGAADGGGMGAPPDGNPPEGDPPASLRLRLRTRLSPSTVPIQQLPARPTAPPVQMRALSS